MHATTPTLMQYLKRMLKISQMDLEVALNEMADLCSEGPRKVFCFIFLLFPLKNLTFYIYH